MSHFNTCSRIVIRVNAYLSPFYTNIYPPIINSTLTD